MADSLISISGSDDLMRNADVGHLLELREKLATSDLLLSALRESVRRLVGEWAENAIYSSDNARSATYEQCASELSALIDGKDQL